MAYSKGAFAESLGISRSELEKRARAAGFDTTEAYYRATGGTGTTAQDQINKENAQTQDFMNRYTAKIASQPTMQDVWKRLSTEYGLGTAGETYRGLSKSASELQQTAEQMPEQVAGETRGYDVSSSQLQRLQQARQGEVYKQLTPIAREAGVAGQNLASLTGQAMNALSAEQYQQEKELQPFATEAELLNSALARQATYYTTDKQNQLTLMLNNLQSGGVSDIELQSLADLAKLEKEFELKKQYLAYEQQFKTTTGGGSTRPALPLA